MVLHEYTYVFAIGTMFVLLEAYNNGASTFPPSSPVCSRDTRISGQLGQLGDRLAVLAKKKKRE